MVLRVLVFLMLVNRMSDLDLGASVAGVLGLLLFFLLCLNLAGVFSEPVSYTCAFVNSDSNSQMTFDFSNGEMCEQICNGIGGHYFISVMMAPHFYSGCVVNE